MQAVNEYAYQQLRAALAAAWKAADARCWLCGQRIDYQAPANEPDALDLDHVKPRKTHPHLALDPSNCRPAHARCNRTRGAGNAPLALGQASEDW